ncbi:MAG: hypothetical protein KDA71_21660 [Planctomycetales bacterium]|nr:hypothetical protein [Planctomycetales bacterium]
MTWRLFAGLAFMAFSVCAGCAKTEEEPHADQIPTIPPGRAAMASDVAAPVQPAAPDSAN